MYGTAARLIIIGDFVYSVSRYLWRRDLPLWSGRALTRVRARESESGERPRAMVNVEPL